MKIKFDRSRNVIMPTLVLTARNGRQLGNIPACDIVFKNRLNAYKELSFTVYKYENNVKNDIWDKVDNLRLCYCPEWNLYFQMEVEINENDYTEKNVTCISLGEAELSQIMIFNTQINTEDDILREDYKPTVLWNSNYPDASLLSRIMEKAPHYKIKHVDESIKRIQRTFEFDNISIYDAFQEIATEIKCIFIIETQRTSEKAIERTVSVYDLENVCGDCGYRGEFSETCPKCDSHNIVTGYGEDTSIYCSVDNLAENINYSVNVDNVKNCFKLQAGDDLMTATIINCNPNGTAYIYYFNPQMRGDMSKELSEALDAYNEKVNYYQTQYQFNISPDLINQYNALVDKYIFYNDNLKLINSEIKGYASLMDAFYAAINFDLYLTDGMMPSMDLPETTAANEAKKLNSMNLENVAVMDKTLVTETTAANAALSYARVLVDNRYKLDIKDSSYADGRWTGSFVVTRYSDETDMATSNTITVVMSDDYGTFVKQKIDKMLAKTEDDTAGIVALFKLGDEKFKTELKKYCLVSLTTFYECCQGCLNVLIEQGVGDSTLWADKTPNLYESMYTPYYTKLQYIQDEIKVREDEIAVIEGKYDKDGNIEKEGIQTALVKERSTVQANLDFKGTIGDELWEEFCSYRRESLYQNENYISDGLNDTELFKRALEFLENAQKEVYKSSMLQHNISATLKNLLVMKEFAPIVDYFDVGNWLRLRVDNNVYKLRLIEYEIDFNELEHLTVEFSDVVNIADGITDLDSILKQAMSVSSSYGTVAHQAEAGEQSANTVKDWVDKGLNVTNQRIVSDADNQNQVWDEHGMLLRRYDEISDSYEDEQSKLINSSYVFTDDNWKTVKTAIGKYYYFDPEDEFKLKVAYGIIGETIVGKVILGEHLGIYTENGSMSFDSNGLNITNGINNFNVNPNSNTLITLSNDERDLLRVDEKGQLYLCGDGSALDINANNAITGMSSTLTQTAEEIRGEVKNGDDTLKSMISQTAGEITSQITDVESQLNSKISQTAGDIKMEIAGYQDEYDTTGYSPTLFGNGEPDIVGCPAADNAGKQYLDRVNGGIWESDGEKWELIYTCETAPVSIQSFFDITKNKITTYVGEAEKGIYSKIEQTNESITAEVTRATEAEGQLSSRISVTERQISSVVSEVNSHSTSISQVTQKVDSLSSSVVTIDETGNFIGTAIEQNAEYVRFAWNQHTDAVQLQNGGLYILDAEGNTLAVLDREGLIANKGIFKGKVQSGDLSENGIVIEDGRIKGYKNNENTSYISANNTITTDEGGTKNGLRIASKGGVTLRGPYLCVSKDYLEPGVTGDVYVGVDSTIRPITDFKTIGEGADRKLQFTYGDVRFVNGICISTTTGAGTSTTDLPEQQAPVGDNTYQADAEALVQDHIIDTAVQERAINESKFVPYMGDGKPSVYAYDITWQKDLIANCNDYRTTNTNCPHFNRGWIDISSGYGGDFPMIRSFPGPFCIRPFQWGWTFEGKSYGAYQQDSDGNNLNYYYTIKPMWFVYVGQYNNSWYVSAVIPVANRNQYVDTYMMHTDEESGTTIRIDSYYGAYWLQTSGISDDSKGWSLPIPSQTDDLFSKYYTVLNKEQKNLFTLGGPYERNEHRISLAAGHYLGVQFYWKNGFLYMVQGVCFKEGNRVYWSDTFTSRNGNIRYTVSDLTDSVGKPYNSVTVYKLNVNLTKNNFYAFDTKASAESFVNYLTALK